MTNFYYLINNFNLYTVLYSINKLLCSTLVTIGLFFIINGVHAFEFVFVITQIISVNDKNPFFNTV